jgi:hypothetical protein
MSDITSVTQTPPAVQDTSVSQKPVESKPQPSVLDTVQISTSAKGMMQEAMESRAQTVQEASKGDMQAQRLQAREAATAKLLA